MNAVFALQTVEEIRLSKLCASGKPETIFSRLIMNYDNTVSSENDFRGKKLMLLKYFSYPMNSQETIHLCLFSLQWII